MFKKKALRFFYSKKFAGILFNTATEIEREVRDSKSRNVSPISISQSSVVHFVNEVFGEEKASRLYWAMSDQKNIQELPEDHFHGLAFQQPLNDHRQLNKYLLDLNAYLDIGEPLVVCVETKNTRKEKKFNKYPPGIKQIFYSFDFLFNRVVPKLKITKKFYHLLRRKKYRVLTLSESLARLVYTGFEIIDYKRIDGLTYIVVEKKREPKPIHNDHYGVVIKLLRIGKDGKVTQVNKIRTMHPYSEYLQGYMFEQFGTKDGDKIVNDFRKTRWGMFLRKYWLDEIPMIWNFLKGDLKIVGVRPISKQKFDTYPQYLKEKRTQVKPGLIPPYYADIPETSEEFFETEDRYLESYFKHPVRTDIRYFFKCLYNILIKGYRSR